MENRFTLRRGDTPPSTENLMEYELGWDKQGKRLYMNDGGESVSLMMHEDEIVQLIYERTFNWIYPVGSLYWSMNNTDPSTLFPGTTWEQIQNRFVYAVGSDTQSGELGGATDGKITLDEGDLPIHSHLVSGDTGNSSTLSATGNTEYSGEHSHSRGSMEIHGTIGIRPLVSDTESVAADPMNDLTGAFSLQRYTTAYTGMQYLSGANYTSGGQIADFYASDGWTGNTSSEGNHLHTVSLSFPPHDHSISIKTSETGESKAFSIMPPYVTAYCWKRIS